MREMTPRTTVAELDKHIVGQADAKKAVAIAIRNRWRRQQVDPEMKNEIGPKNMMMIGPTGVGKTEIARRLATLTGSPFIKVEATKYTEVGYYGRDVESMIRELVENAIGIVRTKQRELVEEQALEETEEILTNLLVAKYEQMAKTTPQPKEENDSPFPHMIDRDVAVQGLRDIVKKFRESILDLKDRKEGKATESEPKKFSNDDFFDALRKIGVHVTVFGSPSNDDDESEDEFPPEYYLNGLQELSAQIDQLAKAGREEDEDDDDDDEDEDSDFEDDDEEEDDVKTTNSSNEKKTSSTKVDKEEVRQRLDEGLCEDERVTVASVQKMPSMLIGGIGMESMENDLQNMFENVLPKRRSSRSLTIREARKIIFEQRCEKLIDREKTNSDAVELAENLGIIFIDEIDKIVASEKQHGADVSRQGVQRDLLPIVEGTTIQTKYGFVSTEHILFVAAGAFHRSKPTDLMPELQGRFPIRVELSDLSRDDFIRILTLPHGALTKQYIALMKTEGVDLTFTDDAIAMIAEYAFEVNQTTQNIGARRLYTIMEKLLEELSFEAPDMEMGKVDINAAYVKERLAPIVADEELNRFIL